MLLSGPIPNTFSECTKIPRGLLSYRHWNVASEVTWPIDNDENVNLVCGHGVSTGEAAGSGILTCNTYVWNDFTATLLDSDNCNNLFGWLSMNASITVSNELTKFTNHTSLFKSD